MVEALAKTCSMCRLSTGEEGGLTVEAAISAATTEVTVMLLFLCFSDHALCTLVLDELSEIPNAFL